MTLLRLVGNALHEHLMLSLPKHILRLSRRAWFHLYVRKRAYWKISLKAQHLHIFNLAFLYNLRLALVTLLRQLVRRRLN